MNLTARERRILKLAREWAKLTPHNYYSNKINAEVLYGAGTARKNCGKSFSSSNRKLEGSLGYKNEAVQFTSYS